MMTDKDRKLIDAAWHADSDEIDAMLERADTEDAREELRFLKRRAYHREGGLRRQPLNEISPML